MTKADLLANALDEFLAVSPEVEAAAVVSADGLPIASALPPHVEEDRLAAMSAALLTLGERAAEGLGKGELAQVFVEGDVGHVILMAAGGNAVLVAVSSKEAKVGLVLFEMRKTAARVASVMSGDAEASNTAGETTSTFAAPTPLTPVAPLQEDESSAATLGGPVPMLGGPITGAPSEPPPPTSAPEPVAPVRTPEPAPADAESGSSVSSWT
ncbi:MAG TPA: roadblock/LC7 domain-containing protein [Actinomycetota bacterium]|nr:roadblock/LC7 domain-containing protein [Actinomycetota bacterium]